MLRSAPFLLSHGPPPPHFFLFPLADQFHPLVGSNLEKPASITLIFGLRITVFPVIVAAFSSRPFFLFPTAGNRGAKDPAIIARAWVVLPPPSSF